MPVSVVFKYALSAAVNRVVPQEELHRQVVTIVKENAEGILEIGVTEEHAVKQMNARVPGLMRWLAVYVGKLPNSPIEPHWSSSGGLVFSGPDIALSVR